MFRDFNSKARKAPKGYKSPLRGVTLCQVVVEPTDGSPPLAVGPGMVREVAEEFRAAIAAMIATGRENLWSNPTVVIVRQT